MSEDERLPLYDEVAARLLMDPRDPRPRPYPRAPEETSTVSRPLNTPGIVHPRATPSSAYLARTVAKAYNCPVDSYDGTGVTIGIIELGGGFNPADMHKAGLSTTVVAISVSGGQSKSDGPNGADGEVMLDVEVAAGVATGAKIRVYFATNTDAAFINATEQAASECDVVSISWGGPETQWSTGSIKAFSAVLATARQRGVPVFVASGDTGSRDSTSANTVDYPASDPSVIGCGGTRLTLGGAGQRTAEVTWDDDDTQSATGGGVSRAFPGRQVPDVAGNASPTTGYQVVVDGSAYVIGGTSAVAPLYAACYAVIRQAYGKSFDLLNTILTNPTICYDVTIGDNGGFKAGPGRDQTTGFGVVDFGKLLTVLNSGAQIPAPGGTTTPTSPTTPTTELPGCTALLSTVAAQIDKFLGR